jgi:hypothetical protein
MSAQLRSGGNGMHSSGYEAAQFGRRYFEAYSPLPFPNPFPEASVEHELQTTG